MEVRTAVRAELTSNVTTLVSRLNDIELPINLAGNSDIYQGDEHNLANIDESLLQPLTNEDLTIIEKLKLSLRRQRAVLLGCEEVVANRIDAFIDILDRRIEAIIELPIKYPSLCCKYKYFDHETALGWRNKDGYPSLAIYSLASSVFSFGMSADWGLCDYKCRSNVPEPFKKYFVDTDRTIREDELRDVYKAMFHNLKINRHNSGQIKSQFKELISSDVRLKIRAAEKDFGDNIFILAETDWDGDKVSPGLNPIVIGLKNNSAWMITTFNSTTLEVEAVKGLSKSLRARIDG